MFGSKQCILRASGTACFRTSHCDPSVLKEIHPFVASWFVASSGTRNLIGIGSHAIAVSRSGGTGCAGFSLIPVCKGGRCYYGRRPLGLANFSRNLFLAIASPHSDRRRLRGER